MMNSVASRTTGSTAPGRASHLLRTLATCVGLCLLVAAIYGQSWSFDFVNFDDDVHVAENPHIVGGLTAENLWWDWGIHGPSQWHPLAWLSHQLDFEIFGTWAGGHHLTNVLLHSAGVVLAFLTWQRLGLTWGSAAFIAAAFAVHPLNVESVAWVSERRNVLCGVFWWGAIYAYASYSQQSTWWRYLLVVMLQAAALMAKPLAVTLPAVLWLLDDWPLKRAGLPAETPAISWKKRISEKIPLLAFCVASAVLTVQCQQAVGTVASLEKIPLSLRLVNAVRAYGWYLWTTIWPVDLSCFYPHPALISDEPWQLLLPGAGLAAVALILISLAAHRWRHAVPGVWLGWLWFLGVMVPMIGIVQVGEQQQADRYAYLPVVGVFLMLAAGGAAAMRRSAQAQRWFPVIGMLLIAAWGGLAFQQAAAWRSNATLYSQALSINPCNHWAHNNWGMDLSQRGQVVTAAQHFQAAVECVPDYALGHYNLGIAFDELGQRRAAQEQYQLSLKCDPTNAQCHQRLAASWAGENRWSEALAEFREAVRWAPHDGQAAFNLGLALVHERQFDAALESLRRACLLLPDEAAPAVALASALRDSGRPEEAQQALAELLQRVPEQPQARALLEELKRTRDDQ